MRLQPVAWCFVVISILFFCVCGPRIIMLRGGPTPAWVDRLPRRAGELCATGFSGPTFYQQDCIQNANDNARAHLAHSISVTIRSISIDISDGSRGYFSHDVFVQGSESASQAVVQGSEVQAQWMDVQGTRGPKNSCFTLVCIDPSKPVEKFVETLTEKKVPQKTVEEVRTNAEAAFKELEKVEVQKHPSILPATQSLPGDSNNPDSKPPNAQPPGRSTQKESPEEPTLLEDQESPIDKEDENRGPSI